MYNLFEGFERATETASTGGGKNSEEMKSIVSWYQLVTERLRC